ncbi:hypothetical protein CCR97_11830 [Rhodoplanes elegans]|uniref:hypothetical protein n=1 Tax=Rhodoplanes elegans TaxID=29408 RepID=UPI000DAEE1E6|nr:hypothetical protein [Rhodoplanes elegans]MBK5958892.1 hypothetical protein [Rhodoplanes elegans]
MNVHHPDRNRLLAHLHAVEAEFPVHFVGLLPRGAALHVEADDALDLLAEKRPGLSLTSLTGAEIALSRRLSRPVGIVLTSELEGRERAEILASARPL